MTEPPVFIAEPPPVVLPHADNAADEGRMTLIEHLEDLRKVLIHSLAAWGVGSVIGLAASFWTVKLLTQPLVVAHFKPVVLSPVGTISVYLKVGLLTGLVLALPVIGQRIWWFVAPGLKPAERRFGRPLLLSSLVLFVVGALLAYGFTYIGIQMLAHFNSLTGITYIAELDNYLGTLAFLVVAFGISFEFPVALVLLSLTGLVTSARLRHVRKYAILIIFTVGYLVTPGVDPITPLPLIIPLLLLYEGSILVIRRMGH
ncbi:MAG: twin-arginine translocase subunit TatC [Candidatus Dormibacteria bacterium]